MRTPLAALAALFLAAHLLSLPGTLEDIDSVNFALGVREFDVTRHQPHPPGYPVFIALARLSTAALHRLDVPAAAPRGLAVWSALAGAALIPLLFLLFRTLCRDPRIAWWATAVSVCSPLLWFSALRPLSDMTGLACAAAVQVLLVPLIVRGGRANSAGSALHGPAETGRPYEAGAARAAGRRLIAGAALAGVAAGIRSQTVMLTAPVLLAALLWPRTGLMMWQRASAVLALVAGALAWAIPLILTSGGLGAYLAALGTQAGEDFAGVVMLWTTPQLRVAVEALLNSFVWPWGTLALGSAVTILAVAGAGLAAWRAPGLLVVLALLTLPYAVFHLLFQETLTMRYALPLVPPAAFLALYAAAVAGRIGLALAGAVLVVLSLNATLPAARAYARDGSPAFRLFEHTGVASTPVLGVHGVMRRVAEWERSGEQKTLQAPHGREWLTLLEHWRSDPGSPLQFLADPRRTDLALFDPHARRLAAAARWTFPEVPFVSGTRPGAADLYLMEPPGWMLGRGWALTAEVGGITARDGLGPAVEPAVAWARARPDHATLILGGRNLSPDGGAPARLTVATDATVVDFWEVPPGPFFRRVSIAAGALSGSGYVPFQVTAEAADGESPSPPVALEQFDLQPDGTVMIGFLDGWQEPEYNPRLGLAWRWMSEGARLWVKPVGRDVTLSIEGESPLRYFDRPPTVRVTVGGAELARFQPAADFTQAVVLPAKALALAGGLVALDSDLWFSPAERAGAADRRHLALRIYRVAAR